MTDFAAEVAGQLDIVRCRILRRTLSFAGLRYLYHQRAARLAVLFTMALFAALVGAIAMPLIVLVVGPMIYGLPHLVSSLRYVTYTPDAAIRLRASRVRQYSSKGSCRYPSKSYLALGLIMVGVAGLRTLASTMPNIHDHAGWRLPEWLPYWLGDNSAELVATAIAVLVLGQVWRWRAFWHEWPKILLATVFLVTCWRYPVASMGILVLAHNFVAFFYWRRACRSLAELRVADIALGLFTLVHLVILAGVFDPMSHFPWGWGDPLQVGISTEEIGASILPNWVPKSALVSYWPGQFAIWRRLVMAYAFGQSLHYFVWLRAIPDQYLYRSVPVTFRQSLGLFRRDFSKLGGTMILVTVSAGVLVGLAALLLAAGETARLIYLSVASWHGYLEIAGLLAPGTGRGSRRELLAA